MARANVNYLNINQEVLVDYVADGVNVTPSALNKGVKAVDSKGQIITGTREALLEAKSVMPTKETQSVVPSEGYEGLSEVTVNPIPNGYVIPSGTVEVTQNGTYDIADYETLNVDVQNVDVTNDPMAFTKELSYATSGAPTGAVCVLTAQEMVDAGMISDTSKKITDEWTHFTFEIINTANSSASRYTNHNLWSWASDQGVVHNGNTTYYRKYHYHYTSTSSTSVKQDTSTVATSTVGYFYLTTAGLHVVTSSDYKLKGPYQLKIILIGRK